ncbi:MAG: DUF4350 domain-containing protein [Anaerolineae bacterium]
MRLSRDILIVLVLLAAVAGLTAVLGARQAEADQARNAYLYLSSYSATPSGTLGLYNWLDGLGYRMERLEGDLFSVDGAGRVMFVLAPHEDYIDSEVQAVIQWVERGNTLVLCDSSVRGRLWRAFNAEAGPLVNVNGELPVEQPLLGETAVRVNVDTSGSLKLNRNDYVTYLSDGGNPLIASFSQGQGRVWLCTVPGLFSNDGLQHDGNAAMVGAMLSGVLPGSVVLFDEFHIGTTRPTPSIQSLLVRTPWGWGVILAMIVLFGYVVLNGRRFGRVLPLPQELARRSPAEYVTSMAQLFRRGDKQAMALKHYRQQLKRRLGRPYALSPDMPDDLFVEALARHRDNLDQEALLQTLRGLSLPHVDDRTLVRLAAQATSFSTRSQETNQR